MKHSNHGLMEINDLLNHFVYIAAHDLKSPISNMKILLEMVKDETDTNKREEMFQFLDKSMLRLQRTIKGLEEVIRNTSEESIVCQIEFNEILKIVMNELTVSYPDIYEHIEADFKNSSAIIYIKPFLISIIRNLISNSYKYRFDNRELHIKITTEKVGDFVKLQVKDNGIGYDMNKVKDVFAPFKRFTKQAEGTGVGLYVLKNIVEKNGGRVEACGQENVGATFTIYLKEYKSSIPIICPQAEMEDQL